MSINCRKRVISFTYDESGIFNIKGDTGFLLNSEIVEFDSSGFLQASWSMNKNSFEMQTDIHGITHLYYFDNGREFSASNDLMLLISKIPKGEREIDYDALSVFFRMGTFIGNDTAFSNIKVLGPNGKLIVRNGKLVISAEYIWSKLEDLSKQPKAFLIDQYEYLFSESIRKLNKLKTDSFTVPLSGGRDSRHIFFELGRQEIEVDQCMTSFFEPNDFDDTDMLVAREISSLLGVELEEVKCSSSWVYREKCKDVLTGLGTLLHAWYFPLSQKVNKNNVLIDGLGGDVLSESKVLDNHINRAFAKRDWNTLVPFYIGEPRQLPSVFDKKVLHKFDYSVAREKLINELEKYADFQLAQSAFEFYNRARRNISLSSQFMTHAKFVYYPYLDTALFKFLSSGPMLAFPDNDFHSLTIQQAYPKWSHLPFANQINPSRFNNDFCLNALYKQKKCVNTLLTSFTVRKTMINRPFVISRLLKDMLFTNSHNHRWICPIVIYLSVLDSLA